MDVIWVSLMTEFLEMVHVISQYKMLRTYADDDQK